MKIRYEFSHKLAPYFDIKYERKFGENSVIARKHDENRDDFIAKVGLRFLF
ncbi:MAG: copper resistance protein B [Rickettsiales bacterium]|jgi:copper resistance protein B